MIFVSLYALKIVKLRILPQIKLHLWKTKAVSLTCVLNFVAESWSAACCLSVCLLFRLDVVCELVTCGWILTLCSYLASNLLSLWIHPPRRWTMREEVQTQPAFVCTIQLSVEHTHAKTRRHAHTHEEARTFLMQRGFKSMSPFMNISSIFFLKKKKKNASVSRVVLFWQLNWCRMSRVNRSRWDLLH